MVSRDKVITGLQCCQVSMQDEEPFAKCEQCPYNDVNVDVEACRSALCADALKIIGAARVMEPEEVCAHEGYVWKEYRDYRAMTVSEIRKGFELIPYEGDYPTVNLNWAEYKKGWRCWTKQPTQKQRKEEKWE